MTRVEISDPETGEVLYSADKLTEAEAARVDTEKAAKPELPGIGHNSEDDTKEVGGVSGKRLKSYLERIERLEAEKSGLADDIKDIYAESKAFGFDTKTLRRIVALRKLDVEKRREADELLELYKAALGME